MHKAHLQKEVQPSMGSLVEKFSLMDAEGSLDHASLVNLYLQLFFPCFFSKS
jgi:hypothetical protein